MQKLYTISTNWICSTKSCFFFQIFSRLFSVTALFGVIFFFLQQTVNMWLLFLVCKRKLGISSSDNILYELEWYCKIGPGYNYGADQMSKNRQPLHCTLVLLLNITGKINKKFADNSCIYTFTPIIVTNYNRLFMILFANFRINSKLWFGRWVTWTLAVDRR